MRKGLRVLFVVCVAWMALGVRPAEAQIAGNPACTMYRNTGQTLTTGLFRFCVIGANQVVLEENTAASGNFSTVNRQWSIGGSGTGIVSGASNYFDLLNTTVASGYSAVEIQGDPVNLGDVAGRFSIVSHTGGADYETFKILTQNVPQGAGPFTPANNQGLTSFWFRNGNGFVRGLNTDGNTFYFGPNPDDANANPGSIIINNTAAYMASSALVSSFSGTNCTQLLNAGLVDSCPTHKAVFIAGLDATDWINIGANTGGATAQGIFLNPGAGVVASQTDIEGGATVAIGWGTGNPQTTALDTFLVRNGAGVVAAATAKTNASVINLKPSSGGFSVIDCDKTGAGTVLPCQIQVGGTGALTVHTDQTVKIGPTTLPVYAGAGNGQLAAAALSLGTTVGAGTLVIGSAAPSSTYSAIQVDTNGGTQARLLSTGNNAGNSNPFAFAVWTTQVAQLGLAGGGGGLLIGSSGTVPATGTLLASAGIATAPVTFSNVPGSPLTGECVWITDSMTATYNATITGGGTNKILGCYDGTNWKAH